MSGVVVVCGDTIGAANEVLRRNPFTLERITITSLMFATWT